MTTRDELIDMFAKIIDPMAWEEPLQPKVNAPFRKRLARKLATEQLAALDKAGLAVAPVKPTIAMLDRAMGKHAAYNWKHMLEASAFAAGRIDKEPEGG